MTSPEHAAGPPRLMWLGPILYLAGLQYFAAQALVALRWPTGFSMSRDTISDLGNTTCGPWNGHYVCSPLHALMNGSLVVLGVTMTLGSVLTFRRCGKGRLAAAAFAAMFTSGLGVVMAGVFPENSVPQLHGLGAAIPFVLGNASIIAMTFAVAMPPVLRWCGILAGAIALAALACYASGHDLGLREGGIERVVAYPQTIWLAALGYNLLTRTSSAVGNQPEHAGHLR